MVKKKKEEKNEKPSSKKTIKENPKEVVVDVEKYPIITLLEMNNIKPLIALGFLKYYGLDEDFAEEYNGNEVTLFSQEEFVELYERYMKREI